MTTATHASINVEAMAADLNLPHYTVAQAAMVAASIVQQHVGYAITYDLQGRDLLSALTMTPADHDLQDAFYDVIEEILAVDLNEVAQ